MGRLTHQQLVESVITGSYEPRPGPQLDIDAHDLATKIRVRADAISKLSKDEANELTEAAVLLEATSGGSLSLSYIDLALLVGPRAAKAQRTAT